MISSGTTRKYLFYAIGEIVLVVLGILIALQINNWQEWRKDRILEEDLLTELKKTIEINCAIISEHINLIEGLNESSDKTIQIVQNNTEYSEDFEREFYFSFFSGSNIYLSYAGYEGLKSSGFELIRNKELKNSIVNLFSVSNLKTEQFIDYIRQHFTLYESFLIQNFLTEEDRLIPIDYKELKNDPLFLAIVMRMKDRRIRILRRVEESLEINQNVLLQMNEELGALNR